MRRHLLILTLFGLLTAACGSGDDTTAVTTTGNTAGGVIQPTAGLERAATVADAPVIELAAGFNDAGFELLRSFPANDNAVLSPTSVGHALLMARAAADQPTGASIDAGFALPPGMAAHDGWNSIDQTIEASNGTASSLDGAPTPTVAVADRIWPRTGLSIDPAWVDLLATHHGADVESIDVSAPEESRARINEWVSEQTNELIPELLPPGFVTGNTRLVLTDALYFKGQWEQIFGKASPVTAPFNNIDGSTTSTEFMRQLELGAPRGIGDGWAAAELPYLGGDYSMLVIVPDDFDAFRAGLTQDTVDQIDTELDAGPYELLLPKWETETDLDLLPWLTDMGAAPGNYPAMGEGTFIGGAVHGAVITVDEIGTEAAAATAIGFNESGPPEPEFTIAADRPFLYLIRHIESGLVLFAGHVTQL